MWKTLKEHMGSCFYIHRSHAFVGQKFGDNSIFWPATFNTTVWKIVLETYVIPVLMVSGPAMGDIYI